MKKEVFVSVSTDPIGEFQLICEYAKFMQRHADFLHCDVMDGTFVPKFSFDSNLVLNINQNSLIMLDVHLMCKEPAKIVDDYIDAGANIVTVHYEAFEDKEELVRTLSNIKKRHALAGLAINPSTPISEIKVFAHEVDLFLVMSVEPGESGQKFIPKALEKIKQLDEIRVQNDFKYKIEVDGGINKDNAKSIVDAGADILVSGSYVYSSQDQIEAVESLKNI